MQKAHKINEGQEITVPSHIVASTMIHCLNLIVPLIKIQFQAKPATL
jgi:hypothetical protein